MAGINVFGIRLRWSSDVFFLIKVIHRFDVRSFWFGAAGPPEFSGRASDAVDMVGVRRKDALALMQRVRHGHNLSPCAQDQDGMTRKGFLRSRLRKDITGSDTI